MSRHGMKYCIVCNPNGNGSTGHPGIEAVGKYYNQRTSKDQYHTGWLPVCKQCAEEFSPYHRIEYFNGTKTVRLTDNKDPKINAGPYVHDWQKENLVTLEVDGKLVDKLVCSKCGAVGYFFMIAMAPEFGCSVPSDP
jgi:hypothetical protein